MTAPEHSMGPETAALEALIAEHGNTLRINDRVGDLLLKAWFVGLGKTCPCECRLAELMEWPITVPGLKHDRIVLPVWTRHEYADRVLITNPVMFALERFELPGTTVLAAVRPRWWIVLNPWCGGEEYHISPVGWRRFSRDAA
jgi:hypothetical protein